MKNQQTSAAQRGEAAEHVVVADLLEQGFTVSWPSSHAAYDLVVEPPHRGLVRVQVKRAYFGIHTWGRDERWMANVRDGNNRAYADDAFDVLAIVVHGPSRPVVLYIPWSGQYRGQKIITEDMFLEYRQFPCESSS